MRRFLWEEAPGVLSVLFVIGVGWASDTLDLAMYLLGMLAYLESLRNKARIRELENR